MGVQKQSKKVSLLRAIRTIYFDNNCVYGARRMHEILKNDGFRIAYHTVSFICNRFHFLSITELTYGLDVPKPEKQYKKVGSRDKFVKQTNPITINEIWVCDWTRFFVYFYDELKPVFIYCIMDLYSRRIIGYKISYKGEDVETQIEVLKETIIKRNPLDRVVIHSDNGDSFKDKFYRSIISENLNLKQSFNRVEFSFGDNSHMESFFATLNKEFYRPSFLKLDKTHILYNYKTPKLTVYNFEKHLRNYINFYNNRRAHSSIGYLTPRQFESSIKTYVPIPYRRCILHVDINACYAQYEVMLNNNLKDKNLVVIGANKRDGGFDCHFGISVKYILK